MSVMFRTQQGRTLCNDEMDVDAMTHAVAKGDTVTGYEPSWQENVVDRVVFHVSARHVVEWWKPQTKEQQMQAQHALVLEAWGGSHA